MTRQRLPNRRLAESVDFKFGGTAYTLTAGYYPDGRVGEIFAHGAKIGSSMDAILADAAVLISRLLQHGDTPAVLAASLGRHSDRAPASVVGALANLLVRIEATAGDAA